MVTVQKFFGYWELDKALIVISWIDIIASIIVLGFSAILYVIMMVKSCDDIKDILNEMKIDDCDMFKTGATVAMVLTIIFTIVVVYVNYLLIKGAKTRNHKLLIPGLILSAIAVPLFSFSYIASKNSMLVVTGVFLLILGIYFFICLYSLYVRFRDEKTNDKDGYRQAATQS